MGKDKLLPVYCIGLIFMISVVFCMLVIMLQHPIIKAFFSIICLGLILKIIFKAFIMDKYARLDMYE